MIVASLLHLSPDEQGTPSSLKHEINVYSSTLLVERICGMFSSMVSLHIGKNQFYLMPLDPL